MHGAGTATWRRDASGVRMVYAPGKALRGDVLVLSGHGAELRIAERIASRADAAE